MVYFADVFKYPTISEYTEKRKTWNYITAASCKGLNLSNFDK